MHPLFHLCEVAASAAERTAGPGASRLPGPAVVDQEFFSCWFCTSSTTSSYRGEFMKLSTDTWTASGVW